MKSLFVLLLCCLTGITAFAQTSTRKAKYPVKSPTQQSNVKKTKKKQQVTTRQLRTKKVQVKQTQTVPTPPPAPVAVKSETEFDLYAHLQKNLRIRYFAEFLGPSLNRIEDNQVLEEDPFNNNREVSRSTDPINLWNQVSFNYHFGYKLNLIVNPRFYLQLGDVNDLDNTSDKNLFQIDDLMFGFQGALYSEGIFTYWVRITHRHPFSRFSRNSETISQLEYFQDFGFQLDKDTLVGMWQAFRFYVYENSAASERYRVYFAPYINYTLSDKWRFDAYLDHEQQHRNAKGAKNFLFTKHYYTDLYVGFTYQINPSFSVYPFIKQLQFAHYDPDATMVGAWIMATFF